jgi:MFS family permease
MAAIQQRTVEQGRSPGVWFPGDGPGKYVRSRWLGAYPQGRLTILLIVVSVFGFAWEVVESGVIGAALGAGAQRDLGMSPTQLSWLLTAVTIASLAAFPFAGPLVDRLGRRPVILFGLGGFVLSDLAKALAPGYQAFLAANIVDGVLIMLTLNPTLALIRDYTPRERRAFGYGIITSLGFGGGTLATFWLAAPVLSAHQDTALFGHVGAWRWLYFYAAVVILVAFVLQLLILRDLHPALRGQRRAMSAAEDADLRAVGPRALRSPAEGIVARAGGQGAALAGIVQYLRSPRMMAIFANQGLWAVGWVGVVSFLPLILVTTVPGVTPGTGTFLTGFAFIAYTVSSIISSVLQDRYHIRKPVNVLAMLGAAVMLFLLASQLHQGASVVVIAVLLFLLGAFAGTQYPAFATVLAGEAELINPAAVGSAFAISQVVAASLAVIPRFVFPQLATETNGWHTAVLIMAAAVALASPMLAAAHGPWRPRRHLPESMREEFS